MADDMGDREPIPPGGTPSADSQGFPPRMPFAPVPGNLIAIRTNAIDPTDGKPLIAVIYDSPDTRVVSYWTTTAFTALVEKWSTVAGLPTLTIADVTDLANLKNAAPFLDKP